MNNVEFKEKRRTQTVPDFLESRCLSCVVSCVCLHLFPAVCTASGPTACLRVLNVLLCSSELFSFSVSFLF